MPRFWIPFDDWVNLREGHLSYTFMEAFPVFMVLTWKYKFDRVFYDDIGNWLFIRLSDPLMDPYDLLWENTIAILPFCFLFWFSS